MNEEKSNKVRNLHIAIGVDILGSKMSFQSGRNYDLEATSIGIKIHSRSSGRIVIIPYSNCKGFEMDSGVQATDTSRLSAANRAKQALSEATLANERQEALALAEADKVLLPKQTQEELMEQAAEARVLARKKARQDAAAQNAAEKAKGL